MSGCRLTCGYYEDKWMPLNQRNDYVLSPVQLCLPFRPGASHGPAIGAEPEDLSTASHVVKGKVEDKGGYVFTTYVFEVMIDKVEKGEGHAPGTVVYLRRGVISKVTKRDAAVPGWIGLTSIPKVGDPVRAHFRREANGRCEVLLHYDAVKVLEKSKN